MQPLEKLFKYSLVRTIPFLLQSSKSNCFISSDKVIQNLCYNFELHPSNFSLDKICQKSNKCWDNGHWCSERGKEVSFNLFDYILWKDKITEQKINITKIVSKFKELAWCRCSSRMKLHKFIQSFSTKCRTFLVKFFISLYSFPSIPTFISHIWTSDKRKRTK